jgi:hypothetical protein
VTELEKKSSSGGKNSHNKERRKEKVVQGWRGRDLFREEEKDLVW